MASIGFIRAAIMASFGVAAISLLLPYGPAFDAWAWLIWGRELGGFELDTSAGASFKPLTVLLATPMAALADAAPDLWLLLARAGWLMAIALVGRLAWRLARSAGQDERSAVAVGVAAALAAVLLRDAFTPWLRQFATGLSEPMLVAAVLGSVEAHLSDRRRLAFGLLLAAALLRPEAWPFLGLYGVYLWRQGVFRAGVAAGLLAVPVLWLIPDLLGSGDLLTGAERARADNEGPVTNGLESIWRTFNLAPAGLVLAAIAWLILGKPPREGRILMALAAGWGLIVLVMALGAYPGLPRYAAPVGAVVSAVGVVGLFALYTSGGRARLVALALGVLVVAQGAQRSAWIAGDLAESERRGRELADLRELAAGVGPDRLGSCVTVTTSELLTMPALAWEAELPVSGLELELDRAPTRGIAFFDAAAELPRATEPTAAAGGWRVYDLGCGEERAGR